MIARIGRIGSVLVAVAFLAGLVHSGIALGAPPTCDGKAATITRTSAGDVIVGTNGPDVIVALGGDDLIEGRGGADTICAGNGDDVVKGGGGPDRILGGRDDDTIRGGPGGDSIDGGRASDRCQQGGGSGPVKKCERADLSLSFFAPASSDPDVAFNVDLDVRNHGSNRASYTLEFLNDHNLSCAGSPESGSYEEAPLAPGEHRNMEFAVTCTGDPIGEPVAHFVAHVIAHATDGDPSNDEAALDVTINVSS